MGEGIGSTRAAACLLLGVHLAGCGRAGLRDDSTSAGDPASPAGGSGDRSLEILSVEPVDPAPLASHDPSEANDVETAAAGIEAPYDRSSHRIAKPRAFDVTVVARDGDSSSALLEIFLGRETEPDPSEEGDLRTELDLSDSEPRTVTMSVPDAPIQTLHGFARVTGNGEAHVFPFDAPAVHDEDWYRVDVRGPFEIRLRDLPADYDLQVLASSASLTVSSDGTQDEEIQVSVGGCNTPRTIAVRVFSPTGRSSPDPYRLSIRDRIGCDD